MDWKAAARVYGDTTRKLRAMDFSEYMVYRERWHKQAYQKSVETNDPKWHGFLDALVDEGDRRHKGEADTDGWLDEVLRYLYEEEEHAQIRADAP